jgi:hypothetical protein
MNMETHFGQSMIVYQLYIKIYIVVNMYSWGPFSMHTGAIGGSEEAVIEIAEMLASFGLATLPKLFIA